MNKETFGTDLPGKSPAFTASNFFTTKQLQESLIHNGEAQVTELRERLFVAEKVMRTLFERNKILEQKFEKDVEGQLSPQVPNCSDCEGAKLKIR